MFSHHIRFGFLFVLLVLLATGCALTEAAQPPASVGAPPAVEANPAVPTAAPATAVPDNSDAESGDTVRLVLVPGQSEARYRVREQLAGVSLPGDAVGSTRDVTGTIVAKLDGTIISEQSKFRVNLNTLKSDRSQRDNFLRGNVLQTSRFPYAEFVPVEAPGLPLTLPASGEVSFKLIGDLTIRNVTKRVTWDVSGKVQGDEAIGLATTSFTFAYFDLQQPRVPLVLSIEDNIRLEMDVHLKRIVS